MVVPQKGKLIVIEALDGAGKSTQIELLKEKFGESLPVFRYPTDKTPKIRQYLNGKIELSEKELFFLFLDDIKKEQMQVNDALYAGGCLGGVVILDRYVLSTICYEKKGISFNEAKEEILNADVLKPDLIILLDVDPKTSFSRKKSQKDPDRYEKDLEYLGRVRNNFLKLFDEEFLCENWVKIDATKPIDEIHKEILKLLENL